MNTGVHYIGNHGVCYGITQNGEYFSYNPEKMGSYYHDTEEEARLSAIKINKMLDKKEMDSIKDFERINAMESIQKKNTVKLNEEQLKKLVAESVKKMLKENIVASAPTFKELQIVLNKVTGILSKFSNNIPQEQSDEFMKLAGREWNDLWESLSSLEETVMKINSPRGLSDSDLTFDDLS